MMQERTVRAPFPSSVSGLQPGAADGERLVRAPVDLYVEGCNEGVHGRYQ